MIENTCKECDKSFCDYVKRQFCSNSCKYQHFSTVRDITCPNCHKIFRGRKGRKFCTSACATKHNGRIGKVGGGMSSLAKQISLYGEVEGKIRYDKLNKKRSMARIGKPGPNKGKRHSEEHKQLLRERSLNSDYTKSVRGKPFDEIRGPDARKKLSEKMKGTFTLRWFISRYGDNEGRQKYEERSKQVSEKSYFKIYNKTNKNNYSNKSQELFWHLYNEIPLLGTTTYFAELNHEYSCGLSRCCFDFVILDSRKVIEFNGDKFHANPQLYSEHDCPNPYQTDLTSKNIWAADALKIASAEKNGYNVFVVWEYDFDNSREQTIQQCINFVKEGK